MQLPKLPSHFYGFMGAIVLAAVTLLTTTLPAVTNGTLLIVVGALLVLLFGAVASVIWYAKAIEAKRHEPPARHTLHTSFPPTDPPTVFVSSPLASVSPEQRVDVVKGARDIVAHLRTHFRVYFAGAERADGSNDQPSATAAREVTKELRACSAFVLFYPERCPTSAIFEAGMALVLRKPSLYFCKDREHLPFLLRDLSNVTSLVKIFEYRTVEGIIQLLRDHERTLRGNPEATLVSDLLDDDAASTRTS